MCNFICVASLNELYYLNERKLRYLNLAKFES